MLLLLLLLLWGIKGAEGGLEAYKGYTLNVEKKVVVQKGLCVLVPCNFSYPKKIWTSSDPIYGYWFRKGIQIKDDSLVATNNQMKAARTKTMDRFLLLGDPQKNDCSLNIREAKKEDAGLYYFRVEKGKSGFNYLWNTLTLDVTGQTRSAKMLWMGG